MKETDKLINEIIPKTKVFYDSIEEQFNYREKNYAKYRILNIITGLSLVLFIFSILPLTSYLSQEVHWITSKSLSFGNLIIPLKGFLIRWIVFTLISGIIYLILRPIDKAFDKKENKYSISNKHLSFTYIYKSIKELEIFLVNDRKEHTETSLSYLRKYIKKSFLNHDLELESTSHKVYLPEILTELSKGKVWIEYSEKTTLIITSFNQFDKKIYERIEQRKEIDLVIETLHYLLVYEYILLDKVKVEKLPTEINDNTIASALMIDACAQKIRDLSVVEKMVNEAKTTSTLERLNNLSDIITGLFSHQNLLITFFAWMILLGLIFSSLVYIGHSFYNINIDSTVYIGAVSGIILGAITFSATIYAKRK